MGANRLQDELLRLASRIGAVEDERDRLDKLLKAERVALWLRDQEIKKLREELAAFPLLPEHGDLGVPSTPSVPVVSTPSLTLPLQGGGDENKGEAQTLGRYQY